MSRYFKKCLACLAFLAIAASAAPSRGAESTEGIQEAPRGSVAAQNASDLAALMQYLEEHHRVTVLLEVAVTLGLLLLAVYGAPSDGEYVYEQHIRYMDKEYRDSHPDPVRAQRIGASWSPRSS